MYSDSAKFVSVLALIVGCTGSAVAGNVVLQPAAVSTDMGQPFWPANNVIDQSGLSHGYSNLTTDFNAYIASAPTTISWLYVPFFWGATAGVRSGHFDFDLGGTYTVSAMAMWSIFEDSSAIYQFNVLMDDNPSFSSPDYSGSFINLNSVGDGLGNTGAEVFSFTATSASYVRLEILNTWDVSSYSAVINEAIFSVAPVPEPSVLALLGLGAAGMVAHCRRKSSR